MLNNDMRIALQNTLQIMEDKQSYIILLMLLLRAPLRINEVTSKCMEVIGNLDYCNHLIIRIMGDEKYVLKNNDILSLTEELRAYADTIYNIIVDLNEFTARVIRQEVTVNDVISRSMTPSAMLLILSSSPEEANELSKLVYYFTNILLAELFLLLSRNYPWFRELISSIESLFST